MNDDERRTYWCSADVELEDVTDEQARAFWQALDGRLVEIDGFEATIHVVEPRDG